MLTALLLLALATVPLRADPRLTPGAVRPMTTATVCAIRWGKDVRHVSLKMKQHIAAAYGVAWADRGLYEFDHKIPRALAGADDILNISMEPWSLVIDGRQMGAREKDRAEIATHKAVCDGRLTLAAAQRQMAADWTVLYLRFVGPFPTVTP